MFSTAHCLESVLLASRVDHFLFYVLHMGHAKGGALIVQNPFTCNLVKSRFHIQVLYVRILNEAEFLYCIRFLTVLCQQGEGGAFGLSIYSPLTTKAQKWCNRRSMVHFFAHYPPFIKKKIKEKSP